MDQPGEALTRKYKPEPVTYLELWFKKARKLC